MFFYAAPALFGPWLREVTLRDIGSQVVPGFSTPATVADMMLAQGVKDRIMHAQVNMLLDSRAVFAVLLLLGTLQPIFGIVESLGVVWSKSKHSVAHRIEGLLPVFLLSLYYVILAVYSDLLWTHPALTQINVAPFFTGTCARLIVSSVAKARFTILDELHLSLPFFASLVVFPLNKHLGLGLDEYNVYMVLIACNFFTYFLYVRNAID